MNLIFKSNPILYKKCVSVTNINDEIVNFSIKLYKAMKCNKGLGLAAVQVARLQKIIALDPALFLEKHNKERYSKFKKNGLIMINAKIIEKSENFFSFEEGCLSFKGISFKIKRPAKVKVKYYDIQGRENYIEASSSMLSACLQHEIDHTNGLLFSDRLIKNYKKKKFYRCDH